MLNELPKKGDEIILIKSSQNTGAIQIEGQLLKVLSVFGKTGNDPYIQVQVKENPGQGAWTIYPFRDEWVFATKEKKIEYWTKQVELAQKNLDEAKSELEFVQKYDCEEEFLADKIEELLASGKTKKQKVEVLKLLTKRFKK